MLKKLIDYIKHRRFCRLNRYYCPDCIYHNFIFERAIFRGNRCLWGEREEDDGNIISNIKCSECLHAQNITGLRLDCSNCRTKLDEVKDETN